MKRVEGWLWAPTPLHWAVVMRIGFGLIYLLCYLQLLPHALTLFGADGLLGPHSTQRVFEGGGDGLDDLRRLRIALPDGILLGLYAALLAAAASFALGFRTRTAGVAMILLHGLFWGRMPLVYSGWPYAAQCLVAYLILADCGRWGSLDARRAGRTGIGEGPAWPRRLGQLHLCMLYLSIGLPRLVDEAWMGGAMVFAALTYDRYARFAVDWHPHLDALRILDWATVALEPLAGLLLWFRPLRVPLVLALLGLHVGLELTTRTGWWQFTMATALVLFVPDRWLRGLWDRLDPPDVSRS